MISIPNDAMMQEENTGEKISIPLGNDAIVNIGVSLFEGQEFAQNTSQTQLGSNDAMMDFSSMPMKQQTATISGHVDE
jgi:hypothetical protein